MSRYRFEPATLEDDAALRARMAADWMRGNLSVSFRREPSYFAGCPLQGEQAQVYKCVDGQGGALVGMGARLHARLYVNGREREVGLLSDLRLAEALRGGTLVARGYKVVRQLHEADPLPYYLTVIMDGNSAALGTLASGRAGLPTYRDFGRMLTPALQLDLPRPVLSVPGLRLRRAGEGDEAALKALLAGAARRRQFARDHAPWPPGLTCGDFFVAERAGGELVACIAAWDQHALRQTHIESYSPLLAALRPAWNLAARALPFKPLPAPGERIPYLYLAALAVQGDDLAVCRALVRHAYNSLRQGPWHFAIMSVHERDPLAAVLGGYRAIQAAGRIFVVHYEDGAAEVDAIDARPPYLDMARI
jgi:hypothetical protein